MPNLAEAPEHSSGKTLRIRTQRTSSPASLTTYLLLYMTNNYTMYDISQCVDDYLNGESINSIVKRTGINKYQIRKELLSNGIELRTKFVMTEEIKLDIIEKYLSGLNGNEIAEIYSISNTTVWRTLEDNGIKRRELTYALRTYPINDHYFDQIDTEDKAYFFGLLFADGNINNKLDTVKITLQEGDKQILEDFTSILQPKKPLTFRDRSNESDSKNRKNQYKMEINSLYLAKILNSYGMVPRKSLIKQFPEVILNSTKDIQRHFIRGYFDGNGSIGITLYANGGLRRSVFSISSTYQMCDCIKIIISNHMDTDLIVRRNHDYNEVNNYVLISTKIDMCYKIFNWLYKDSNYYLERKYEKYLLFKQKVKERNEN